MMSFKFLSFLLLALVLAVSCKQEKKHVTEQQFKEIKKTMPDIHRNMVKNIADSINNYVVKSGKKMQMTNTGMWYEIYDDKSGVLIKQGDVVYLDYKLMLLDSTVLYTSDSTGQKNFTVGSGGVEKGLEELVLFLSEGDKAQAILPPHLGHGLSGDLIKIPRLSILKYDICVKKVVKEEL